MTDQFDLDAIQTRVDAATPGPWGHYDDGTGLIDIAADLHDTGHGYHCRRYVGQVEANQIDNDPTHHDWTEEQDRAQSAADAEFIAHARTDVPAMAEEIRRLRAQRRLLLDNLARKDAATGAGDKALAEFLGTETAEPVRHLEDGSTHTVATLTEAGEACVQQECVAAREEKRLRQEEYSLRAVVEGVLDEVGYLADDERITADVVSELRERLRDALGLNPPAVVEEHVVADDNDDPEHIDDCPGCETAARRP